MQLTVSEAEVIQRVHFPPLASRHIHAKRMRCDNGTLPFDSEAEWQSHPLMVDDGFTGAARSARDSWRVQLNLEPETRDSNGKVARPGLRVPQIGALHALAAHWSIKKNSTALVVLPTGTGKTEVMLASLVSSRPNRLLVPRPYRRAPDPDREEIRGAWRL